MERRNINMITTNEKQTTQQQEFITDLITYLTRVNDEMILSFVADIWLKIPKTDSHPSTGTV